MRSEAAIRHTGLRRGLSMAVGRPAPGAGPAPRGWQRAAGACVLPPGHLRMPCCRACARSASIRCRGSWVCRLTGRCARQVAGLDVGWGQELDLQRERGGGRWALTRELPPGRFPYKFIVDGRWTCSADHPTLMARRRPARARRAGSRQPLQRGRHAAVQRSAGSPSRRHSGQRATCGLPAWGASLECQRSSHACAKFGTGDARGATL